MIAGQDMVRQIENLETDKKNRPEVAVFISNCGELVLQAKAKRKKLQGRKIVKISIGPNNRMHGKN